MVSSYDLVMKDLEDHSEEENGNEAIQKEDAVHAMEKASSEVSKSENIMQEEVEDSTLVDKVSVPLVVPTSILHH